MADKELEVVQAVEKLVTPFYTREQAVKARLYSVVLTYGNNDNANGRGSATVEYYDGNGHAVDSHSVNVTDTMLTQWDGTANHLLTLILAEGGK